MNTKLISGAATVLLPAAEFNNVEGNLATVKIQRSMVGDTYSTVKRVNTVTLKLHFELERANLKQLQAFLLGHGTDLISLTDWQGHVYVGYIYNDTFQSTETQQWANSIDLLFEGKRLL